MAICQWCISVKKKNEAIKLMWPHRLNTNAREMQEIADSFAGPNVFTKIPDDIDYVIPVEISEGRVLIIEYKKSGKTRKRFYSTKSFVNIFEIDA